MKTNHVEGYMALSLRGRFLAEAIQIFTGEKNLDCFGQKTASQRRHFSLRPKKTAFSGRNTSFAILDPV